eukprot:SAG22_NODE_1670_length_3847_cov_30.303895_2_plen_61_part_00
MLPLELSVFETVPFLAVRLADSQAAADEVGAVRQQCTRLLKEARQQMQVPAVISLLCKQL